MSSVAGQEFQQALMNVTCVGTRRNFPSTTFDSLDFEDGTEKEAVTDYQGQQISYVIKPQKTSAQIVVLTSEAERLWGFMHDEAVQLSRQFKRPIGPGQVAFGIDVSCGPALDNLTFKRRLKTVLIQKWQFSSKKDQSALYTTLPLFVLKITDDQDREFMGWKLQ